jgi:hypothetical protein
MSVADTSQNAIANLGWTDIKLPAPVFVGDPLFAVSEVLSARPSDSRPGQGLVTVRTEGRNATGTTVIAFERTFLVPSGAAVAAATEKIAVVGAGQAHAGVPMSSTAPRAPKEQVRT